MSVCFKWLKPRWRIFREKVDLKLLNFKHIFGLSCRYKRLTSTNSSLAFCPCHSLLPGSLKACSVCTFWTWETVKLTKSEGHWLDPSPGAFNHRPTHFSVLTVKDWILIYIRYWPIVWLDPSPTSEPHLCNVDAKVEERIVTSLWCKRIEYWSI